MFGMLLLSCKSNALPNETRTETIKTVTNTVKDTIIKVEKDNSYYEAYLKCVDGKPVIINNDVQKANQANTDKTPISKPGKYLDPPKVDIDNSGKLTVNCEAKARDLFLSWKETYIQEFQRNIVTPEPIEKQLTTFQSVKMFIGNIVFYLLCAAIFAFLIRFIITKKLF